MTSAYYHMADCPLLCFSSKMSLSATASFTAKHYTHYNEHLWVFNNAYLKGIYLVDPNTITRTANIWLQA